MLGGHIKRHDKSPVMHYNVKVSQRDLDEIKHLINRNFAGMSIAAWPGFKAITEILLQINDQSDELDNYDNDGAIPKHHAPEHEELD